MGNIGEFARFANATARSRDSAPRGQGGGSPPCTSCLFPAKNNVWRSELIPALGALCGRMIGSAHCVPRKPKTGINYSRLSRLTKNHPEFTGYCPHRVVVRGIRGFLQMLQQGPGIARRADRVGVPPHAPTGLHRTKTMSESNFYFHLWAHSAL